ncbi:hypothetical protein [Adlercreutzia shanghongiae]|uniref:Uncharacterized protein n=1 Tax=Adlercreutzia shanghongiae TaxID=3111773 RepID=A0ABU6J163_9ACTN|nr:hypothetical protein [Adlercreutzia sp. R22]MEC4295625.1 hypothetical protein [Adlercreutzia sp. R22]
MAFDLDIEGIGFLADRDGGAPRGSAEGAGEGALLQYALKRLGSR